MAILISDFGPAVTFAENLVNRTPQRLDADVLLEATTLPRAPTIVVSGLLGQDRISLADLGSGPGQVSFRNGKIRYEGVLVGSATGGVGTDFTISLNAAGAAPLAIEAVLEALTYANVSHDPIATRTLSVFFSDPVAGTDLVSIAVDVTPEPDPLPGLTRVSPIVAFAESTLEAAPRRLDADVTFAVADTLSGARLSVSGLLAEDVVGLQNQGGGAGQVGFNGTTVRFGGAVVGTASGGQGETFTVQFNAAVTAPAVEAVIEALTYDNDSETPTASRVLTIDVVDNRGAWANAPVAPLFALAEGAAGLIETFVGAFDFRAPAFLDLDDDGDLDLVVGTGSGRLGSYRNTGSGWELMPSAENPFGAFDGFFQVSPAVVDFNNDGRVDLVVSAYDVGLAAFANTPSGFVQLTGSANPFDGLLPTPSGLNNSPTFVDLDSDGRADLVLGREDGTFSVFRNTGTGYVALNGAANPLASIGAGGVAAPTFLDLDGDGRMDMVSGNLAGTLRAYHNTGTGFIELTGSANPLANLDFGFMSRAFAVDLDRDGWRDLVVGGSDSSKLFVFHNATVHGVRVQVTVAPTNDLPVGPASRSLDAGTEDTLRVITAAELRAGWTDSDGEPLSIADLKMLGGVPGTLVATGPGAWTFTPAANATGTVVFQYVVSDGTARVTADASLLIAALNDTPTGAVTIAATDMFLSALSTLGDADGLGGIAWQWQRFSGGAWKDIAGATGPALGLTEAPAGQPLRVLAQYTDGDGTAEQVVSATTAVVGSRANETLAGAPDDSLLLGQAGNDALLGGAGRDVLVGGRGLDTLTGGAEADAFRFTSLKKPGTDSIVDFLPGTDRIEVLGSAFGLAPGVLPAAALVAGPMATAAAPQFLYDAATGLLRFDANGTAAGGVTEIAILGGAPALTASDILVL